MDRASNRKIIKELRNHRHVEMKWNMDRRGTKIDFHVVRIVPKYIGTCTIRETGARSMFACSRLREIGFFSHFIHSNVCVCLNLMDAVTLTSTRTRHLIFFSSFSTENVFNWKPCGFIPLCACAVCCCSEVHVWFCTKWKQRSRVRILSNHFY